MRSDGNCLVGLVLTIATVVFIAFVFSPGKPGRRHVDLPQSKPESTQPSSITDGISKVVPGTYRSTNSQDVLSATLDIVSIRREKSTWARLPNDASGVALFDRDDLKQSRPYRLRLLDNGKVELTGDATPPFPEEKLIFIPYERSRQ